MSKKTITEFYSDLSEAPNALTIEFSFGGNDYEIDLTDAEIETFTQALQPYVDSARTASKAKAKPKATTSGDNTKAIRAWAEQEGLIEHGKRGRLPGAIKAAYAEAH